MEVLRRLSELLKERSAIDRLIAAQIDRPALSGHIGEYIGASIFDIELCANANQKAIDGVFRSGKLAGKTVNIKHYGKKENLLDITPNSFPDYYLVMTGPKSPAMSSKGQSRPFLITSVFLFNASELIAHLQSKGVKIGVATSLREKLWTAAEIFPRHNPDFILSDLERDTLALFA